MSEVVTRVAVLGVEGDARAQLRRALSEFGADIAIEGDPRQLDPQLVGRAAPTFILVSLDEAIEDALDAYQLLFDDPQITVIFDEAAVTRELGGWELARWARHLASKLLGDQTAILPAAPAHAPRLPNHDLQPQPGAPTSPEQAMRDARLEDYTRDTVYLARDVPVNDPPGLQPVPAEAAATASMPEAADPADAMALELNSAAIELALIGRAPLQVERTDRSATPPALDDFHLDVDLAALDREVAADEQAAAPAQPASAAGMDWAALEAGFDLGDFGTPVAPGPVAQATPSSIEHAHAESPRDGDETIDLAAELEALEASLAAADADAAGAGAIPDGIEVVEVGDMGDAMAVDAGADDFAVVASGAVDDADDGVALELLDLDAGDAAAPVNFAHFGGDDETSLELDPALVAMAAELDARQTDQREAVGEPDFAQRPAGERDRDPRAGADAAQPPPAQPDPVGAAKSSFFGALELTPVDEGARPVARTSAGPGLDILDFDALVAGLSLVEADAPAVSTRRGAVAIFAGTGGPDAVRQVLAHLPQGLPVPVLVVQKLEAGNHDRLVPQLAKVCPLPVILAAADRAAAGGAVAVLPTGMGLEVGRHGDIRFAARGQSSSDVLDQLATLGAELVVVIASGADHELAEALARCLGEGAVVFGQEPSSCFDCAAVEQVKKLGGRVGAVGELTAQAVKRWES